jgi:hypothetical protein
LGIDSPDTSSSAEAWQSAGYTLPQQARHDRTPRRRLKTTDGLRRKGKIRIREGEINGKILLPWREKAKDA